MKRGTPRHRKMRDLSKRLSIPLAHAVGIMEMIWHYAGQETPQGDIGIADDAEIAAAANWTGQPSELVQALIACKWLDEHPEHRLLVHDWPEHADNSVKKWLERNGKDFLPVYSGKDEQCPEKKTDIVQKKNYPPAHARAGLARLGSDSTGEYPALDQNHVEKTKPRDKFDEFWGVVWVKVGKDAARQVWKRKITAAMADGVIEAAKQQGPRLIAEAKASDRAPLHPRTWLHQGRYEDELPPIQPSLLGVPIVEDPEFKPYTAQQWRETAELMRSMNRVEDAERCEQRAREVEAGMEGE